MTVIASFKEYVKELYHNGIRSVGKFIAPIALAGTIVFVACAPSAPPTTTPIPINCNKTGKSLGCTKAGQTFLSFRWSPEVTISDRAELSAFISPELTSHNSVDIYYRSYAIGREDTSEELQIRTQLTNIPIGQETTLKFRLPAGCYMFYVSGLNSEVPLNRTRARGDIYIGNMQIGAPSLMRISANIGETEAYNNITLSGEVYPFASRIYLHINRKEGGYSKMFEINPKGNNFEINWIPERTGDYKIEAYSGSGTCEVIGATSNTLEVKVRE